MNKPVEVPRHLKAFDQDDFRLRKEERLVKEALLAEKKRLGIPPDGYLPRHSYFAIVNKFRSA